MSNTDMVLIICFKLSRIL